MASSKKSLYFDCLVLSLALLGAHCNSILGFEDGRPFPPDASDRTGSSPDASADAKGTDGDVSVEVDFDVRVDSDATSEEGGATDATSEEGDATVDACSSTTCNGACVDVSSSVTNCGRCGHDCTSLQHVGSASGVSCSSGKCVIAPSACATGWAHCTSDPDDGCETDLGSPTHCGTCTTACGAATPLCSADGCKSACPSGTTQCGTSCVDLGTDAKHCGDCAKECAPPAGGGIATCQNKTCGTQCLSGSHACPGTAPKCAADTDATACGPTCAICPGATNGDAVCSNGQCSISCHGTTALCGSACVDRDADPKNCGTCGHDCTALAHVATATGVTCSAGKCVIASAACASGFAHCSSNPDDGCETDVTSPQHCRSCTRQCPVDNPNCSATGCTNSCPGATPTLCGSTCANLASDVDHCGACVGGVCPGAGANGTRYCISGQCKPSCNDGSALCGNQCPDYTSDAKNCGSCGHSCGTGVCVGRLCCAQGQINANGICCAPGQINANGICCASGQINANGICCPSGQTNCGGVCVDTTSDVNHCGGCPNSCPTSGGLGTPHCNASQCSQTCKDGKPVCGTTCCPSPPANSTEVCDAFSQCSSRCVIPLTCSNGGVPQCGSWGFESGEEGWAVDPEDNANSDGTAVASSVHSIGLRALAIGIAGGGSSMAVSRYLCNGSSNTTDLSGFTHISAQVWIEPAPGFASSGLSTYFAFHWFRANPVDRYDYIESEVFQPTTAGQWITITGTVPAQWKQGISRVNLDPGVYGPGPGGSSTGWKGKVYLDNVQLVP